MPPQTTAVIPSRRSLESGTVWALIATIAVTIFAFTPFLSVPLATTKTFLLMAGALVTLVLYILSRLSRGNVALPPFTLVGALWLPVIAYLLSAVFSGTPFASALWGSAFEADTLGFIFAAAGLGTLTAFALRRAEQYKTFLLSSAWIFTGVSVLSVGIVIVGQFAPSTVSPSFTFMGTYQDLAFFLGLGVIGMLITFRFLDVSLRGRQMLSVATLAALALLAIANSLFVWIMLALVALGLFIETIMMRKHGTQDADLDEATVMNEPALDSGDTNRPIVLPLLVLAVSLFFLVGGNLGSALSNALRIDIFSVSPNWQSTLITAQKTYATAPIFGSGPGTFSVQWLKFRDASLNTGAFWNADFTSGIGFIPTSFVTTGILGAIAWIAFFGLFLVFGIRMLIVRTPQDSFVRYVAILSFVASIYLFAIGTLAVPSTVILALGFIFAGLFASTMRFAAQGRQWGIIFARSPRVGFVVVFSLTLLLLSSVVGSYALIEHYIANVQLARASASFTAGKLAEADRSVQNAISFAPTAVAYQAQANIATLSLREIAASTTIPVAVAQQTFQATLSSGINAALTATRLAPSDYRSWIALGNLYAQAVPLAVSGAYESANTAYEKARELNPTNPEIPYIMAQLDIAHKDIKSAQENLKETIALKPDYAAAIFLLSQLQVQDGQLKEALDTAISAAYFAPKDPTVLFQIGILRAASNDLRGAGEALTAAVEVSPQFANARYFLAAVLAKLGDFPNAQVQLKLIAELSPDNARVVAPLIESLQKGKNPFPANLLSVTPATVE